MIEHVGPQETFNSNPKRVSCRKTEKQDVTRKSFDKKKENEWLKDRLCSMKNLTNTYVQGGTQILTVLRKQSDQKWKNSDQHCIL